MKRGFLFWLVPFALLAETPQPSLGLSPKWKLQSLTVARVSFRDADPREAIRYLQEQSGRLSPDKQPLNIVWLVPKDAGLPRVSMNLANVPLGVALQYVVQAAHLRARTETHAVVIEQRPRKSPADNVPAR